MSFFGSIDEALYKSYAGVFLKAWAVVDGVRIDIHSLRLEYAVNQIPICVFSAAIGREARTGLPAPANGIENLVFQIPVSVYITIPINGICGSPTAATIAPPGDYNVFNGYLMAVEYSRDVDAVVCTITCVHWLYDLNYSSSLSDISHPQNPLDLTFNAFIASGAGSLGALTVIDRHAAEINPANLAADLWGRALKPILISIASSPMFASPSFSGTNNQVLLRALSNFIEGQPPLTLRRTLSGREMLYAIFDALVSGASELIPITLDEMARTTIWERLVNVLSPLFLFVIIPHPSYANVVPYNPTYTEPWVPRFLDSAYSIPERYIFSAIRISKQQKTLKGLGFIGSPIMYSGSNLGDDDSADLIESRISGVYVGQPYGMVKFTKAPFYLDYVSLPTLYLPYSLGTPKLNTPLLRSKGLRKRLRQEGQLLGDALAHYFYTIEMTKETRLLISGPLRFDIAPGSIVTIDSIGGRTEFTGPPTPLTSIIGYVNSIIIKLQSIPNRAVATTSFELAFVRSMLQGSHPNFSMYNPLYETWYSGDSMRF